jgi:hypothetical protein
MRNAAVIPFALALTLSHSVWADGTHSTKIAITNNVEPPAKIRVATFNGDDNHYEIPHKMYQIGPGNRKIVKCHGNGKHRCGIFIRNMEADSGKNIYQGRIDDNGECTVSGTHYISCPGTRVTHNIYQDE